MEYVDDGNDPDFKRKLLSTFPTYYSIHELPVEGTQKVLLKFPHHISYSLNNLWVFLNGVYITQYVRWVFNLVNHHLYIGVNVIYNAY